jgi:hypothetical protein
MAPEKKEKEIKMRINKIRELEFSDREIVAEVEKIEFGKNLLFAINFAYSPNLEKNTFALKTHVKYTFEGEQDPVLTFLNEIVFDIFGMEEVVKINTDTNEIEIINNFLIPLISVAIGTTRGMLASKTTGKKINAFPIPMLNPQEVLRVINKK